MATNHTSSFVADLIVSGESFVISSSQSVTITTFVSFLQQILELLGVPEDHLPSPITTCRAVIVIIATLIGYYCVLGKRHWRNRRNLAQELQDAQAKLNYLEDELSIRPKNEKKNVRIFMDGAFDVMHYGHMNAFRLARSLGTELVVGINSDESITECKGPPLMNEHERLTMVQSCKFVDEVVPNCPYIMNQEYLDYVIDHYKIDYVIHGDDPCIVNGKDVYETAKKSGKFRSIPRTEGVSTTDIVGRMLLHTKEHHLHDKVQADGYPLGRQSKFLTTSRMLQLFSNAKAPTKDMRVIYMDGTWDLFHPGHVAILKAARERGDYLIVGIHGDAVVNKRRGMNLPLMNLHERVLSVLGCRFVDDVLIDAPYEVTPEMVSSLNIAEVVHGTKSDDIGDVCNDYDKRYKYPKQIGIYVTIPSPANFNLGNIVQRVRRNQESFQAKFERKMKAENEHFEQKYGASKTAVAVGK